MMDWAQDYKGLGAKDLSNVFRYGQGVATVVRIMTGHQISSQSLSARPI